MGFFQVQEEEDVEEDYPEDQYVEAVEKGNFEV